MRGVDSLDMIGKKAFQGLANCDEREFIPGNFMLVKECHFEAFCPCREIEVIEFGQKQNVYLTEVFSNSGMCLTR